MTSFEAEQMRRSNESMRRALALTARVVEPTVSPAHSLQGTRAVMWQDAAGAYLAERTVSDGEGRPVTLRLHGSPEACAQWLAGTAAAAVLSACEGRVEVTP